MNELEAVVQATHEAWEQGHPALLATVVGVRGSAYRRPGARMLLTPDGWRAGSISGGCLEGDLVRKAWWRTRNNKPVILTYDSTIAEEEIDADELSWGFGLGCNGVVEVLLERLVPGDAACPVGFIAECLRRRRPGVMATVIGGEEEISECIGQRLLWHGGDERPIASSLRDPVLAAELESEAHCLLSDGGPSRTLTALTASGGRADVYLERILPPTPLLICGAGHDAVPLTQLAKTLGWHVTVVDPRAGMTPRADRFPGADAVLSCAPAHLADHVMLDTNTTVVVMSHNVVHDAALLAVLLPPRCAISECSDPVSEPSVCWNRWAERDATTVACMDRSGWISGRTIPKRLRFPFLPKSRRSPPSVLPLLCVTVTNRFISPLRFFALASRTCENP